MKYLRDSEQTNSELEAKARLNIALGYQRMLTFQHPDSGGFSWFGSDPEHLVLTAYGLMELTDMAQVFDVDENVLNDAARFLAFHQASDGHWEPPTDRPFGTGGSVSSDRYQATTFVAWALLHSGLQPIALQRAITYLMSHREDATTNFSKALLAVFLSEYQNADQTVLSSLLDELADSAETSNDGGAYWNAEDGGSLYDYGSAAVQETTALAAMALLGDEAHRELGSRALAYLISQKDAVGNFQSTQATVFTLKALMTDLQPNSTDGTVTVLLDGNQVAQVQITPDTADVFRTLDLKNILSADDNQLQLLFAGDHPPSFQVVGLWYVPWSEVAEPEPGPLDIDVQYDRTELRVNETISVLVSLHKTTDTFLPMVIVDLGTPPGFEPMREDLDGVLADGTIANYEVTDRQVIVYTNGLQPDQTLEFSYRIQATMAFSGESPGFEAYTYYTPEVRVHQAPISVTVTP